MAAGDLVPDSLTNAVVARRLTRPDTTHGFLLDGFPRTLDQAHELDDMLERRGTALDGVLALVIDAECAVRRLSGRRTCRTCGTVWHLQFRPPGRPGRCDACGGTLYQREDDADSAVRTRLEAYEEYTAPLRDFYAATARLAEVDATGVVEDVSAAALGALDMLLSAKRLTA
jgi:adenylate kinase